MYDAVLAVALVFCLFAGMTMTVAADYGVDIFTLAAGLIWSC